MRREWTSALALVAVAALVGLVGLVVPGCQSAGSPQPSAQPGRTSFDLASLKVVAFMGVAPGGSHDKQAVPLFEPMLERQLAGITPPFVLMSLQDTETRARSQGLAQEFRDIGNYWRDQQKVDKMKLQRLCDALGIQGILVGGLREWMQVEATPNSDEPSYTKISAVLSVYDAASGRRVWRTRSSRTVEAALLQGDEDATARDNPLGTGFVGGMRTGSDAPPVEDVAALVVGDLVDALVKGKASD
jgi:hypothetical protein